MQKDMESFHERGSGSNLISHHCQDCSFKGKTSTALRRHVTVMHPGKQKPYQCNQCNYKSWKKNTLRIHTNTHRDEKPYQCNYPLCSFRTKTQHQMNRHKKCHDPDQDKLKVYSCTFCDYRCRFKPSLACHIRTHTGDKPYACDSPGCNYRARQLGTLQFHRRKHKPDEMLTCYYPECEFRATRWQALRKHQEMHNPERKKDFQCPLCPKKFATKDYLRSHIKQVHTNEHRISCNFCGILLSTKWTLRSHVTAAHASETVGMKTIAKKYKCTACDFKSPHSRDVRRHQQRSHSNVKNFACDKCEFRSTCQEYLRNHGYRCPGLLRVRSFQCHLCKKKFFTREYLSSHLKNVHRTDKPFKCHHCSFSTNYAKILRDHQGKKHSEGEVTDRQPTWKNDGARISHPVSSKSKVNSFDKHSFRSDLPGCNILTVYGSSLKGHHERRHLPKVNSFQCPMCSSSFYYRSAFNKHIRAVHVKERPFKCDKCDYSASRAAVIREHKQRKHITNKVTSRLKDIPAGKLLPAEQLGIAAIFSCPFCDWTHNEYIAAVLHTVPHRVAVVSLERHHLVFQ